MPITPSDVTVRLPQMGQILWPANRLLLLKRAANTAISRIRLRTRRSVDVNGRPFKPYTPAYRAAKVAAGRSSTPDLTMSGAMLANIQILRATPDEVTIGFAGSAPSMAFLKGRARWTQKNLGGGVVRKRRLTRSAQATGKTVSNAEKAAGNQRKRRFFALSAQDKAAIVSDLNRLLASGGKKKK